MPRKGVRGDIDAIRKAIRPRLGKLGIAAVSTPPTTIPPHTHHASEIVVEPEPVTALISADDAQEALEELGQEKLARSGEQPMLGALDMNDHEVDNIEALNFNLTPTHVHAEAALYWNATLERLALDVSSSVVLAYGSVYLRVKNNSGSTIDPMTPVMQFGSGDVEDAVGVTDADPASLAFEGSRLVGVAMQSIADEAVGWACAEGYVGGVDLSAWGSGGLLYLVSAGTLGQYPDTPLPGKGCAWHARIGTVINAADPGSFWVDLQVVPDLDELSNVHIGSVVAKQYYDVPMWLPPGEGGCDAWRDYPASRFPTVTVDDGDSPYSVADKDVMICVDASAGNVVVDLPQLNYLSVGRLIRVKLIDVVDGYTCEVTTAAAELIDGMASVVLKKKGETLSFQADAGASDWRVE